MPAADNMDKNPLYHPPGYSVTEREYLWKRPWLTVRKDSIKFPDGRVNPEYYVLEYPDWINVTAITEDGKFIMERQYRHGLGIMSLEICAGVIEAGETPLEAARRELLEETGYSGGEWEEVMTLSANPSTTNNLVHCFMACGVRRTSEQNLDPTESIEVCLMSEDDVYQALNSGKIVQSLMAAPLWRMFALKNQCK